MKNDRSGAHSASHTDTNPLNDGRAGTDMNALVQVNATGQCSSRRNVHMIAEDTVVIDDRSGIDDDVVSQPHSRLHDGSRHHLQTLSGMDVGRNRCGWMNDRLEDILFLAEPCIDRFAKLCGAAGSDTVHEPNPI